MLIKNMPPKDRWAALAEHVRRQVRIEVELGFTDEDGNRSRQLEGTLISVARIYGSGLAPVAVLMRANGGDIAVSLSKIRTIKRIGLGS